MYPHLRLDSFLDRRFDASCRCVIIALAWVISMTPWYLRTAVPGDCLVWFLRLIHCPNLCKNTDGTSATSKKMLSDQWESMSHETLKNPPRKIIFACGLRRKVSLVSTSTVSDWNFSALQKRRSLSDLRRGSKRAFAIASFPGIRSCFFSRVQLYAIKTSNCYQLSYVMKYYELRLGKVLTKLLGWQALGCWSRSWAMRSQDSQRQCATAVTHAFHDDFDENWPTLHSFRRSME